MPDDVPPVPSHRRREQHHHDDHPPAHGHSHGHSHDDGRPLGVRLAALASRRVLLGAVLAIVVATVAGLVVLWPGPTETVTTNEGETFFGERVDADITSVTTGDCSFSSRPGEFTCDEAEFVVTSGTPRGRTGSLELPLGAGGAVLHEGDEVILSYGAQAPEGAQFQFADFQRTR
ncbi:MAG: hypothetical protein AB7L84_10995, partial [Acidimicrobiia bacterium]